MNSISSVLAAMHNEQAVSLIYISSNGTKDFPALALRREATDDAIHDYYNLFKERDTNTEKDISFKELVSARASVNELKLFSRIDKIYNQINIQLLDRFDLIVRGSNNSILNSLFALELGRFEGAGFADFIAVKADYEENIRSYKKEASPELKDFFEQKYQGVFVDQMTEMVDSVYLDPSFANFNSTFENWWATSSAAFNQLKEVEKYSADFLAGKANEELKNANSSIVFSLILLLAVFVGIILTMVSISTGIVKSISKIDVAVEKMADGFVGEILDIQTNDEIGKLSQSFNKMSLATEAFSKIADEISNGNYTAIINPRSDDDKLAYALENMKVNLGKLAKDNEIRNWLLTGTNVVNEKLRGDKDVRILAADTVLQLSTYLNANIGAIYINENNKLVLTGTYAFDNRKNNANTFDFGEGLVGQAAVEKNPIIFNEIPSDYIRINSGLGNSVPKSIIVFPFVNEGEVKGVIELGAVDEFTELDMQLLNLVGLNIAIAIHASQARSIMKDLLEETQRQAEEMEVQQEELKQTNEELETKTGMLEKSEAELKVQQEELQQTNEELEEKANLLEEQKERLENAKVDIENKAREVEITSKYKSEFLANMSHELRTPLNSILILAKLLSENKSKNLGEKEVDFSKNIYKSSVDLLNLINEILDLSKVESGKMELDIEPTPLKDISDSLTAMFTEVATNKSIEFSCEISNTLLEKSIQTDGQRLEQVLRNLLSNAFKFTGKGGKVALKIEKAAANVRFRNSNLKNNSEVLSFSVSDNGIGIPQEKFGIIFEAFQQVDGSTKRKYGGTGLGLSISRELASALGGEIQLHSEEGKGTTFTFFIPFEFDGSSIVNMEGKLEVKDKQKTVSVSKNENENVAETKLNANDDRNKIDENDRSVLIIEDDEEFAALLLDFVRERGYKGIVAHQGNTGLSYARYYKPDAIILDMKLPVMNGDEVLKHLKNDPNVRHIPVQIISGYDKRKEGIELGAFDFNRKPISVEDLGNTFSKIEHFLDKKLKNLLVVEDNEMQNSAIKELIGGGDVKSFSAFSGQQAYEMLVTGNFDCMIVDLGLPDMTGFELMEKIKKNEKLNKIPIVVYTGKELSKDESTRLNKLASTVVLKTANSEERLLDETVLFLHRVESQLPKEKQKIIRDLHKSEEVLKNKVILVVDDDVRNIYSLTNALEEEGMKCLTAENGKAAIDVLKNHPEIKIVLMDVMMPEMDGYEATKEIRSIAKFNKLPIIALTAKAMKGDREKCLEVGMNDYIAKPVKMEQLLSLMRVWLY
jgi:CheY-like chemotaxis protein/putative methionine-R-sulfoxide reductase with GAF domain/HAMP domain-containing protein